MSAIIVDNETNSSLARSGKRSRAVTIRVTQSALRTVLTTLRAGRDSHPDGAWDQELAATHVRHAVCHLERLCSHAQDEDHLAHAATRLLMALELRERES